MFNGRHWCRVWSRGISLNVIIVITQSVVDRSILGEHGLAFGMLHSGKGTLSASETVASSSTISIGTWASKCVVNWSHKGGSTDT